METRVEPEISKQFPYLNAKYIKVFIPKLVYEFVKYVDPETIEEIGKFDINESICLELENEHLVIVYHGLHGEKNFQKLAALFNRIDPGFDAYYTDASIDSITYKRFYALCLNAEYFLKQFFTTNNLLANTNLHPEKKTNLYIQSDWFKQRKELHIQLCQLGNHYAVPQIQAEIMIRKTAVYNNKANMQVEKAILEWKNKRSLELFFEKILLLFHYVNMNYNYFPKELFNIIICLVMDRLVIETENKLSILNPMTYHNLLLFKNGDELKRQECRIFELCFLVFDDCCFREFAILEDYAVLKFAAVDKVMKCVVFNRLFDLIGEPKDFWYEQHRNEKTSTTCVEYSDIYICFPKEKLSWFKDKLENKKNEILQAQQNEYITMNM